MRRFADCALVVLRCPSGDVLRAAVAGRPPLRLAGLAGLPQIPERWALVIPRCRSVHTIGMRFALDVAFVAWPPDGGSCAVLFVHEAVRPLRMTWPRDRARPQAAVEMRAGTAAAVGLRAGVRIGFIGRFEGP